MKIVFFGTSSFSASILDFLLKKNFPIVAVVTRVDKPQGRNLALKPPPVKEFLQKHHPEIPVFQPVKASTKEFEEVLKSLNPDLFVVVAYGEIMKQNILDIPRRGSVNIHPSLLPKYRGAAPIHAALLNGDPETGVSIIEMVLKMDAGDILASEKISIDSEDNFESLEKKLLKVAERLIEQVIIAKEKGTLVPIHQEESLATYTSKILPEMETIDWSLDAKTNWNRIRALSPYPGAWCQIKIGEAIKRLKILQARLVEAQGHFSKEIVQQDKKTLLLAFASDALEILEVQLEGKKRMTITEFLSGLNKPLSIV